MEGPPALYALSALYSLLSALYSLPFGRAGEPRLPAMNRSLPHRRSPALLPIRARVSLGVRPLRVISRARSR